MCKGRNYASKEMMIFAAVILSMWDIEPAGGQAWKIPGHERAPGTLRPKSDVKVWIKRRQMPAEQQNLES